MNKKAPFCCSAAVFTVSEPGQSKKATSLQGSSPIFFKPKCRIVISSESVSLSRTTDGWGSRTGGRSMWEERHDHGGQQVPKCSNRGDQGEGALSQPPAGVGGPAKAPKATSK